MHISPRCALFAVLVLAISTYLPEYASGQQVVPGSSTADKDLHPPPEFRYGADGVTEAKLIADESQVMVGDTMYHSLVFNNSYDAPLLRTRPGGVLRVTLDNRMDELTNLHFHGMTVSPLEDGDNIFRETAAHESFTYNIKLPLNHNVGAFWYHSHFHGGAQRQVSGGIAGPIIVDGVLDPFPELQGIKERVIVLRNFQKTLTGKLASEIIAGAPSIRTINGQKNPEIHIAPGEVQLWHVMNVAANQYFRVNIDGQTMQVLSRDGNPAVKEVLNNELLLGPSARISILVTGPQPGRYTIGLEPATTGATGDTYSGARLGTLISKGDPVPTVRITSPYPISTDLRKEIPDNKRRFVFQDSDTDDSSFLINGRQFESRRVDTTVKLGDMEEWLLVNPSQELHQFHIHQTDFQVVKINGKPVDFEGYRDNVYIPTTGSITIRIPFLEEAMLGKFVYHCHILEHEDGGMMQAIQVVRPQDYEQAVKLEPLGGIYGDNESCAFFRNTGRELFQNTASNPASGDSL